MKLNDEFKDIELKAIAKENITYAFRNDKDKEKQYLDEIDNAMKILRENNWEETFVALYLLYLKSADENIKLGLRGRQNGKLYTVPPVLLESLLLRKEGMISFSILWTERITCSKNNVIIKVLAKDKLDKVKSMLDEICTEWENTFFLEEE